jgi:hypothetical protein
MSVCGECGWRMARSMDGATYILVVLVNACVVTVNTKW